MMISFRVTDSVERPTKTASATRPILSAVLMLLTGPVLAAGIGNVTTSGTPVAFWQLNPANCTVAELLADPGPAGRTLLVQGELTSCVNNFNQGPGGFIELDADADAGAWVAQTLNGTFTDRDAVLTVTASSLVLADWEAGSFPDRLVDRYINEAITANCNVPLDLSNSSDRTLLGLLSTCFLTGDKDACSLPVPIIPSPAQRASDPDVAYVNRDTNGQIRIGLAGIANALDLPIEDKIPVVCPKDTAPPAPPAVLKLSEVVKIEAVCNNRQRAQPQYLYSFAPFTPTNVLGLDPWYNAVYEVSPTGVPRCRGSTPPEPPGVPAVALPGILVALLGLALMGWRHLRHRLARR